MVDQELGSKEPAPAVNTDQATDSKPLTQEDLLKRLASMESTNARLLEESKKYKSSYSKLKDEVDSKAKATLEEQGQYKELYTKLAEDHASLKKTLVREKVVATVTSAAQKFGVVDVDVLLALGNPELIQYDEQTGAVNGIELFLEDFKKKKPHLVSSNKPAATVNPIAPGGMIGQKTLTASDVSKLKQGQRNQAWADAFKKQVVQK